MRQFDYKHSLYPRKFSLVPEIEECTNAIFGIKVAVVFNESESAFNVSDSSRHSWKLTVGCGCLPFASIVRHVDDCLLAHNLSEAAAITCQQFVGCIRAETADVDVSCPISIVQDLVQATTSTIRPAAPCRDRGRDSWICLRPHPEISDGVLSIWLSADLLVVWQLS